MEEDKRSRSQDAGDAPRVWQVGSGAEGRNYAQTFIDHDLMLVGPGDPGPYDETIYQAEVNGQRLSAQKSGSIARFARNICAGDVVLLRRGYEVVSVGVVPESGGYSWEERYGDLQGWNIQHCQRVAWGLVPPKKLAKLQIKAPLFAGRKNIPMFTRVHDPSVLARIGSLIHHLEVTRDLATMPGPPAAMLTDESLGHLLFSHGLSTQSTELVVAALRRQRRLLRWFKENGSDVGDRPKEHEVVAYLVLPLLLALGWSEQLVAVEWKKIDVACFRSTPTNEASCAMVIEAKALNHGLETVRDQAARYVDATVGLPSCDRIVATQGSRFLIYDRESNGSWPSEPTYYFNVERMRETNLDGSSPIDAIMALRP